MNLKEKRDLYRKEFEENYHIKDFILRKIEDAENEAYDPYSEYGEEFYLKCSFNINVFEEHERYKESLLKEIRKLDKIIYEIEALTLILEDVKEADIVKSGKQIAKEDIFKKMSKIYDIKKEEKSLLAEYERLFGLEIRRMSEEEIDKIELTVYTDCQPW